MSIITVIHKVRAFIGGRTYGPGEIADIDETDFAPETHDKVDADGNVIGELALETVEPLPVVAGTETNENTPSDPPAPVPERASSYVIGSPTVEDAAQSEPTPQVDHS